MNVKFVSLVFSLFAVSFGFLFFPTPSYASLINIKPDGKVIVNVLGAKDSIAMYVPKRQSLSVNGENIEIFRDGETFKLALNDSNLDITQYQDNLIEIEETPEKERVKISLVDGKFKIEQEGIAVLTSFPIEIDPSVRQISVKTETGKKYLAILPKEASAILLRSKLVDKVDANWNLLEEQDGVLVYKLKGNKTVNIFNISKYSSEIETQVSAADGVVIGSNEPVWLKILSFFLSSKG